MVRTIMLAVAVAAAASVPGSGLAQAPPRKPYYVPRHYVCTGTPPQYDPRDLNQMRASISASSRLALAIRQREFLASCHPAPHRHPHHES